MNRKDLLGFLCLGSMSAISGCADLLNGESDESSDPTTNQPKGKETTTPAAEDGTTRTNHLVVMEKRIRKLHQSMPSPNPRFNFNYGEKQFNNINDRDFEVILATGQPALKGDELRITPGKISAQELAARLRIVWGVDEKKQVTRTIESTSVDFTGGVAGGYAFLVGVTTAEDSSQVLVTRAESLSNAKKLTNEFRQ